MADFNYMGTVNGAEPTEKVFDVAAGAVGSILAGQIVSIANGYAAVIANGGATAGNGLYGLAVNTSTDTVGAAGTITVKYSTDGLIVRGVATTPANLVAAVLFDKVTIDVAASVQTVDENDAGALLIYKYPTSTTTTDGIVDIVLPFTLAS